jgi:hypothetical protein
MSRLIPDERKITMNFTLSSLDKQRRIVAYLDGLPPIGDLRQAKVNALRELQSETQEELDALLPSRSCDKVFNGK